MKIINLAVAGCMAAALASCGADKNGGDNDARKNKPTGVDGYTVETVTCADSVAYGDSKAVAKCTIGYLKADSVSTPLIENINAWTRYALGNTTGAKMGQPLAKDVVDNALASSGSDLKDWDEQFGNVPMAYEMTYSVKPIVMEPNYVTMLFTSYIYLGGAHGESAAVGQTFDATTGQTLGDDMIRPDAKDTVLALVKEGLMKQYFKVSTEQEFNDCLLSNNGEFTLPANPPYFMEDGVCFLYQQYEIAPYSEGMPQCTISYASIRPYLTPAVAYLIP